MIPAKESAKPRAAEPPMRTLLTIEVFKDDQTGRHFLTFEFDTPNLEERVQATVRAEVRLQEVVSILRPFIEVLQVKPEPELEALPPGPDETTH